MKHVVNLSGGKDSTAMLLMMLDRGELHFKKSHVKKIALAQGGGV